MRKLNYIITALMLIALSALPFVTVAAQGEEPQIRITQVDNSKFPNVTVYVSVTNAAGEPVGVDPSTIQIFEDGQLMQPVDIQGGGETVGEEPIPVTTMLVMDISGSMDKNDKLAAAKEAAKSYVNQMRPPPGGPSRPPECRRSGPSSTRAAWKAPCGPRECRRSRPP